MKYQAFDMLDYIAIMNNMPKFDRNQSLIFKNSVKINYDNTSEFKS